MLIRNIDRFRELQNLQENFERMNRLFNMLENREEAVNSVDFTPAVNTREGDSAYYVEVDIPGVKKEDITIDVEDNALRISGERKIQEERKDEEFYRVESLYGKFERLFSLPDDIDASKIEAEVEDGVLYITIPKKQTIEQAPKKIKIK